MGEPSLRELEHDVEVARSKLAQDLSILRSPDTYSQFTATLKQEASSAKDALAEKAKASVQSTLESFVEELKAKAAANPTAALAIGAGIAWRLIQHPPIATALIGAGFVSLMRTNAGRVNGRSNSDYFTVATERLRDQAAGFAADIKEQAGHAVGVAADKVNELAGAATDRVGGAVRTAAGQMADGASAAKERIADLSHQATSTMLGATEQLKQQAKSVADRATDQIGELRQSVGRATDNTGIVPSIEALSTSVENAVADRETRDSLLLGVAGVAVIAALGIACQKKLSLSTQPIDLQR